MTATKDWESETHTEDRYKENPHSQTFKQLDCMWGDGHWWLHKPYICLTADISGPLRKRDEASSNSGLKMREAGGQR